MGAMLAASLCFSALCDVGLGWLLRHHIVSASSAAFFMVLGATLSAVSLTAFAGAGLIPCDMQLPYVLITLFMFRFSYALFDLPHNTIMAFVTTTDAARGSYGAIRYPTSGMAIIMIAVLLGTWLEVDDQQRRAIVALFGCGIFGLLGIIGAAILRWQIGRDSPDVAPRRHGNLDADDQFEPITYFPLILISIGIYSCLMASFTKLQAYFIAFTEPGTSVGSSFMIVVALGQIFSQFFWACLARIWPLLQIYRIAAVCLGFVALAFVMTPISDAWLIYVIGFLYGGASSGLLMTIWSMQAAAAKVHLGIAPQRYGQFIFVSRLAQATALLTMGHILTQFDFRDPEKGGIVVLLMASGPFLTACLCSFVGWWTHRKINQS